MFLMLSQLCMVTPVDSCFSSLASEWRQMHVSQVHKSREGHEKTCAFESCDECYVELFEDAPPIVTETFNSMKDADGRVSGVEWLKKIQDLNRETTFAKFSVLYTECEGLDEPIRHFFGFSIEYNYNVAKSGEKTDILSEETGQIFTQRRRGRGKGRKQNQSFESQSKGKGKIH